MGGYVRKLFRKKEVQQQIRKQAVKKSPTKGEMDAVRLASIKRKGRKATKLGMEDEDLTLAFKTLLG